MSLVVMIALGLIPWVIAVERLIRGRNRDLDYPGPDRPQHNEQRGSTPVTETGKLLADDTLFGAIISPTPIPAEATSGHALAVTPTPVRAEAAHEPAGGIPSDDTTREESLMAAASTSIAHGPDRQWPRISPDLAIIDSFVPGDDMLELTLDEAEVAAAERAGVRLDIRVERSSTGRGSLITVGGTPLAFVRGSTQVTPRDVVLRIDRLDGPPSH